MSPWSGKPARRVRDAGGQATAWRRADTVLLALAVLLAVLVYRQALDNPFVYDDRLQVVENDSIRHLDRLANLITKSVFRPVVNLSYAVDYRVWGLRPLGFHLTSLLIHLLNVALVFVMARRVWGDLVGGSPGAGDEPGAAGALAGFATAGLFAVHPVLTEAVGYVSARSELLAGCFMLASFLALRRFLLDFRPGWAILGLGLFLVALGCKEVAGLLPVLLLAYDRLVLRGEATVRRRRLWLHVPLLGLLVPAVAVRLFIFVTLEGGPAAGLLRNAMVELVVAWRYVFLLVLPYPLSLVHDVREITSFWDPSFLAALAGTLAVLALLWWRRRSWSVAAFCALWFALVLAPSHVVPLKEAMAEHRVYVASIGLLLLVGTGLARVHERSGTAGRRLTWAVLVALLGGLSWLSVARLDVWSDPVLLWRDAAAKAPQTWAPQYALADTLRLQGRCEEAIPVYAHAIELLPGEADAYLNLGICLGQLGRLEEARRAFSRARELAPASPKPANNLATLAILAKRPAEARDWLEEALRLDPRNIHAREVLAQLYETTFGDPRKALELCREIRALAPGAAGVDECIARNEQALAGRP